jgi:RNA polymerase sigma factor (sigma-70 family)
MPFDPQPSPAPSPVPLARLRRLAFRIYYGEGRCCDVDDLIQEGALAVLEARRLAAEFTTSQINYEMRVAYLRMLAFARRWIGRSPKRARNIAAMYAARERLTVSLGREPSANEVADLLGWKMDRMWRCMVDAQHRSEVYVETIEDAPDLETQAIEIETADELRRALAALSQRHGWVMRERAEGRTHLSLAKESGCGRTKIMREEKQAIGALCQAMGVSC